MKVAVAVITDEQNSVLIARRPLDKPHGGIWEFPGGKVEPRETPQEALVREVKEEVGLAVLQSERLTEISHAYGSYEVTLHVFHVFQYQGEAAPLEAQLALEWVPFSQLDKYQFPEANFKIVTEIASTLKIA